MRWWLPALMLAFAACAAAPPAPPQEVPRLQGIFNATGNRAQGNLVMEEALFERHRVNVEQERWRVMLSIRSNAYVTSACSIMIQAFDRGGRMLDEYLVFNDTLPYESVTEHRDEIFVKREHVDRIARTAFFYNCLKKDVLGPGEGH